MRNVVALIVVLCLTALAGAQETPEAQPAKPAVAESATAPVLTEVDQLKVQNLMQAITIAQLKAQQAQAEFVTAREAISTLLQSLQVPGYDLSLETMTYTKKADPKSEP